MSSKSSAAASTPELTAEGQPERSLAPAVVRAARILDLISQSPAPLALGELARELGLPKSSVHGLCATLTQLRLIRRLENGQMTLGPHVMTWANGFLSRMDITQEFFAVWDEMSVLPKETITLSVLDGPSVVYIGCRNGTRPLGVTFRIGMRLPAPFTATGKAILSTLSEREVREILTEEWPAPLTDHSTRTMSALLKDLTRTAERGYSIDAEELRQGMHCFGAPVFDSSGTRAVAGVAVSILSQEVSKRSQETAGRAIRQLADKLSERLGAKPRE